MSLKTILSQFWALFKYNCRVTHMFSDTSDTFYCIKKRGFVDCTPPNKRRKWNPTEFDHVTETIDTLADFYRRINEQWMGKSLNQMLNTTFTWAES